MGKEPDALRREIEETRQRMGETLDALASKADVSARAKDAMTQTKETVLATVTDAKEIVQSSLARGGDAPGSRRTEQTAGSEGIGERISGVVGRAQDNPFGVALGSIAVGFLLGTLLPSTRTEAEMIGPVAERVKDTATKTGLEAIERGRDIALERARAALVVG